MSMNETLGQRIGSSTKKRAESSSSSSSSDEEMKNVDTARNLISRDSDKEYEGG